MKLVNADVEAMPRLYSTEDVPTKDKIVAVKFFNPVGRGTWYGVEYEPDKKLMFGYVVGELGPDCDEWGYWSMDELEAVRLPLGLGVERDTSWTPQTAREALSL